VDVTVLATRCIARRAFTDFGPGTSRRGSTPVAHHHRPGLVLGTSLLVGRPRAAIF